MEVLDLVDVPALAKVRPGVRRDPQNVDLAGLRINLDPGGHRVTEGIDKGNTIRAEHVNRGPKGLPAVVAGGDPDLADREVVVGDVDLILSGGDGTRIHRHPGTVDEGRVESCEVVDRPMCAAVVAYGETSLERQRKPLDRRHVHAAGTR